MKIDWQKGDGLIPAVIQDYQSHAVLMLGYMNEESWEQTKATKRVTFFSRSRGRIWVKGETSGNFLDFVGGQIDCDGDTLLIQAKAYGPVCHTGTPTCFGEDTEITREPGSLKFLKTLGAVIDGRFRDPGSEKSYVAKLIQSGTDRMAQKVGEEGVETVIASKNDDLSKFEGEAADLLFHLMVLLRAKGSSLEQVAAVLESRHKA